MNSQAERWSAISQFLNQKFYKPDLEALAIALSAYIAHWSLDDDPVWLFIVGPSGTGKTSIICNALSEMKATITLSDLSPTAFISGLDPKMGGSSLLFDLSRISDVRPPTHTHGILIFKDFTSILSRRPETRAEIISAMREIADGRYSPRKGRKVAEWQGKVTVIAAATPAVERAWAVQRDLGERFVQVRWGREDGIETAKAAIDQLGQNHRSEFKRLIAAMMCGVSQKPPTLSGNDVLQLAYPAELTARLRGHLVHDTNGSKSVIEVSPPESPSRIVKAMAQIAVASARLFGREQVAECDLDRARRVALDSVPFNRLRVFNQVSVATTASDVSRETGMPLTSVAWILDELTAIEAIVPFGSGFYDLSKQFETFKSKSVTQPANVIKMPAAKGEAS